MRTNEEIFWIKNIKKINVIIEAIFNYYINRAVLIYGV